MYSQLRCLKHEKLRSEEKCSVYNTVPGQEKFGKYCRFEGTKAIDE